MLLYRAMDKKFTAREIVHHALNWGEENIANMIEAHTGDDDTIINPEHVAYLKNLRAQMRAYRKKRFGWVYDPLAGTKRVNAMTTKFKPE